MAISKIKSDSIDTVAATKLTGTVDNARIALDAAEVPNLDAAKITTGDIDAARLTNVPATADEITKQSSDPTISSPATPTLGDVIVNTTSGEMFTCTTVSSGANVWANTGDGTGTIQPTPLSAATGGSVSTVGDYKIHTFTTSSQIIFTTSDADIEWLCVAGGGGGGGGLSGSNYGGGGGGAGGYRTATGQSVSNATYTVTIGGGGAAGVNDTQNPDNAIASSIIGTGVSITSSGGGGGASRDNGAGGSASNNGHAGGSGGGAVGGSNTGGAGNQGNYTPVEGYAGCVGYNGGASGGGGASETPAIPSSDAGGVGGVGESSSITGSAVPLAGGGGGGSATGNSTAASGGTGGGGAGGPSNVTGTNGSVNTGGGGGGAGRSYGGANANGGAGGSGIVSIKYRYQ